MYTCEGNFQGAPGVRQRGEAEVGAGVLLANHGATRVVYCEEIRVGTGDPSATCVGCVVVTTGAEQPRVCEEGEK